jgi:hypothetical protein
MRSSVGLSGRVFPLPSPDMPHTNGVCRMGHSSVAISTRSCKVRLNGTLSRLARDLELFKYFLRCCSFTDKLLYVVIVSEHMHRKAQLAQLVKYVYLPGG